MAYTKKTTTVDKAVVDTAESAVVSSENVETAASPGVIYKTKDKIPMDALVMVKNLTGGKLIYTSKALNGYTLEWNKFGEEVPVEMKELYNMKNTDRRFFTENWIEVDINVLRDLRMDIYYKDAIKAEEIETLFKMPVDKLVDKVSKASKTIQNTIGLKAIEMIENRQLTDINVITALEKVLNCELYERA